MVEKEKTLKNGIEEMNNFIKLTKPKRGKIWISKQHIYLISDEGPQRTLVKAAVPGSAVVETYHVEESAESIMEELSPPQIEVGDMVLNLGSRLTALEMTKKEKQEEEEKLEIVGENDE